MMESTPVSLRDGRRRAVLAGVGLALALAALHLVLAAPATLLELGPGAFIRPPS
jgi:threonine/homoserine/homoserine lactone efflux protein